MIPSVFGIRGTVHSDLENYCLRDSCNFKLKTGAYVWPCAIWLVGPAMVESPLDFEPDMKSILQLQDRNVIAIIWQRKIFSRVPTALAVC